MTSFNTCALCAQYYYWCQSSSQCMQQISMNCDMVVEFVAGCPLVPASNFTTCATCAVEYYWCITTSSCVYSPNNCANAIYEVYQCPVGSVSSLNTCEKCVENYYWCAATSTCSQFYQPSCATSIAEYFDCPLTQYTTCIQCAEIHIWCKDVGNTKCIHDYWNDGYGFTSNKDAYCNNPVYYQY